MERNVSSLALEGMLSSDELLSSFDVDEIATEALLFQTGYLTIHRAEPRAGEMYYRLGYSEPGGAAEPEPEPCSTG